MRRVKHKSLIIVLVLAILLSPVLGFIAFAPPIPEAVAPTSNLAWKIIGLEPREDITDASSLTYSNYEMTFSYAGYYITFQPYVVYNSNIFTIEEIVGIFPSIRQNVDVWRNPFSWKYGINISNIPSNIQSNIQYIGLKRTGTNLLLSDIEVRTEGRCFGIYPSRCVEGKYLVIKNKVMLTYFDLLERFTVQANLTDILIGNITANIVDGALWLDPEIKLDEPDTEILEDTFVDDASPDTNYGTQGDADVRYTAAPNYARMYLGFNLTSVVQAAGFDEITDATLYLNYTDAAGPPPFYPNLNMSTHWVNNTIWSETAITWNNQPCGGTGGSFNGSCTETFDTGGWEWINFDADLLYHDFNVTTAVRNYNTTDEKVSLVFTADIITATGDNGYQTFGTKEATVESARPYLNVTYSESVGADLCDADCNLYVEVQDAGGNALISATYIHWNTTNGDLVNATGWSEFSGLNNGTYVLSGRWQNSTNSNGVTLINSSNTIEVTISGANLTVMVRLSVYNITVQMFDNSRTVTVVENFTFTTANNGTSKTVCAAASSCLFYVGNGTNTPSTIYWQNSNVRANTTDTFTVTVYNSDYDWLLRIYDTYGLTFYFNDAATAFTPTNVTITAPNSTSVTITSYTIARVQNGTWTITRIMFWENNVKPAADPTFSPTGDSQSATVTCRIYATTPSFDDLDSAAVPNGDLTSYAITFPNTTQISGLTAGSTYWMQNGSSTEYQTVWLTINVTHADNTFDAASGNPTIQLRLKSHSSRGGGYIGLNDTITGNSLQSETNANLTFTPTDGAGVDFRIIIEVNLNATYVEKDNVNITWTWTTYIAINTTGVGKFEVIWVAATYSLFVEVQDMGANALTSATFIRWNTTNIDLVNATGWAEFNELSNDTYVLTGLWQNSTNSNGVQLINSSNSINVVISGTDLTVMVRLSVYNITIQMFDNSRTVTVVENFTFTTANNGTSKTVCSTASSCLFFVGNGTNTPETIYWQNSNVRANTTDTFTVTVYNSEYDWLLRIYDTYALTFTFNDAVTTFTPTNITLTAPNSTSSTITSYTITRVQNGTWTITHIYYWEGNVKPVANPTFTPTGDSQTDDTTCRIYSNFALNFRFDDSATPFTPTNITLTSPNSTSTPLTGYTIAWAQNGTWTITQIMYWENNVKPIADPTFSPTANGQSSNIDCRIYSRTVAFDDLDSVAVAAGELTSYTATAPNTTVLSSLSTGTAYWSQNGTFTVTEVVWRVINVTHASNTFDPTGGAPTVQLRLKDHASRGSGYIGVNSTITGNTIQSETNSNLTFTMNDGGGVGFQIIIEVNVNATFIEKDDVNITWTWNSPIITINTTGLSKFEVIWVGVINTSPVNIALTISNMDDTNYVYSQARAYTFIALWNDTDGVADLDFGSIAFSDGLNWLNITVDLQSMVVTIDNGSALMTVWGATNSTSGNQINVTISVTFDWDIDDELNVELYALVNDTAAATDGWDVMQTNYFNIESDLETTDFGFPAAWGYPTTNYTTTATIYYEGSTTTQPPDGNFTSGCIIQDWNDVNLNSSSMTSGVCSVIVETPASNGGYTYSLYMDGSGDYPDGVIATVTFYISPETVSGMEISLVWMMFSALIIFLILSWLPNPPLPTLNRLFFAGLSFILSIALALAIFNVNIVVSSGAGFIVSTRLADAYVYSYFFWGIAVVMILRIVQLSSYVWAEGLMLYFGRSPKEEEEDDLI